jgi:hypothetical protein
MDTLDEQGVRKGVSGAARVEVATVVKPDEGKVDFTQHLRGLTCGMRGQDTSQDPPTDFPVLHELTWQKRVGVEPKMGCIDEGGWTEAAG